MNYSQEITGRLGKILLTLLDLFGSKKFQVALGGGVSTYLATGDPWAILYAALAYIAAQGLADALPGKEKAFVDMAIAAMKQGSGVRGQGPEELVFRPAPPIPAQAPPITGKPVGTLFPVYITEALVKAGLLTIESILAATDDELEAAGLTDSQIYKIREMVNLATLK